MIKQFLDNRLRGSELSGDNHLSAFCPFHSGGTERHRSFSVNLDTGLWCCYACHESGGIHKLLKMLGCPPSVTTSIQENVQDTRRKYAKKANLAPVKDEDTVLEEPLLGVYDYCPNVLVEKGFDPSLLKAFEVGFDRKRFRITYPIRSMDGELIGVSGRRILEDELEYFEKYKLYTSEIDEDANLKKPYRRPTLKGTLWNGHRVRLAQASKTYSFVIVVEGFNALLRAVEYGYPNTVATFNAHISANSGKVRRIAQQDLIVEFSVPAILFYDNDPAGIDGTMRSGTRLSRVLPVLVARYPKCKEGTQPDDLSRNEFYEAVQKAEHFTDWRKHNAV